MPLCPPYFPASHSHVQALPWRAGESSMAGPMVATHGGSCTPSSRRPPCRTRMGLHPGRPPELHRVWPQSRRVAAVSAQFGRVPPAPPSGCWGGGPRSRGSGSSQLRALEEAHGAREIAPAELWRRRIELGRRPAALARRFRREHRDRGKIEGADMWVPWRFRKAPPEFYKKIQHL
jgi:hypothetical protein